MSLLGTFFGTEKNASLAGAKNWLDTVTSTAVLASNPHDIDPLLDQVRDLTASLQPGEALSETNEATLRGVYLKLEDYLTTKESLRTFTKQELRGQLNETLRVQLSTHEAKGY